MKQFLFKQDDDLIYDFMHEVTLTYCLAMPFTDLGTSSHFFYLPLRPWQNHCELIHIDTRFWKWILVRIPSKSSYSTKVSFSSRPRHCCLLVVVLNMRWWRLYTWIPGTWALRRGSTNSRFAASLLSPLRVKLFENKWEAMCLTFL